MPRLVRFGHVKGTLIWCRYHISNAIDVRELNENEQARRLAGNPGFFLFAGTDIRRAGRGDGFSGA